MAVKTLVLIFCAVLLLTLVHSEGFFEFEKHLETFDCSLVAIINYGNMDFGPLYFPTVLIRYAVEHRHDGTYIVRWWKNRVASR